MTDQTVATEDTGLSDEQTLTTEDTQGTDLEDMELSFDELQDDTEESESEVEDEAATESEAEVEEESEVSGEPEPNETSQEDEERKRYNNEMAQRRIAERAAREQAKRSQQMEYLQSSSEIYESAIDKGFTHEQALQEQRREEAVRQLQIDAYNNRVTTNHSKLESGLDRAIADIDLFSKGSQAVKEELVNALDEYERLYVVRDENGDPVEVKADIYNFYQQKADSIRRILNEGAVKEAKDKTILRAKTDTVPSRKPKTPKVDPDLAAFDEEVASW